jgi:hypothetical protein
MDLRHALGQVKALGYDPSLGAGQPAQTHLRQVKRDLVDLLPPTGLRVRVSGAAQNLPRIAWIAVLNPEVTTTAQQGLYVVYLFDASISRVYLTLNQGVTAHRLHVQQIDRAGLTIDAAALNALAGESALIRAELASSLVGATVTGIDLGADGFLPKAYEAGTIAAVEYDLSALPFEGQLRDDLARFLWIYDAAVDAKWRLTAADPATFVMPAASDPGGPGSSSELFRPKDASDYVALIAAHSQVRSRRHEAVVKDFGEYVKARGWTPATNVHPRDLTLRRGSDELLCEIKVVKANATGAVREAIGQLFTYRHFLYPDAAPAGMVAVFSDAVGDAFVDLLEGLGIVSVWPLDGDWCGSPQAIGLDLVDGA